MYKARNDLLNQNLESDKVPSFDDFDAVGKDKDNNNNYKQNNSKTVEEGGE